VPRSPAPAPWIALLRAINVGGHQSVSMAHLRAFLSDLGFAEPRSLLQSGNLVFHGAARSSDALERLLEAEAAKRLGLTTDFLVRSVESWERVIAGNPFRAEAERGPSHVLVMLLKDAPNAKRVAELEAAITGPELVRAGERHLYLVYPAGIGRSRLTSALIEKTLGTRGTARNWNTVVKLAALAGAQGA
jgi:uncharacterized protein (DUF1697 family)